MPCGLTGTRICHLILCPLPSTVLYLSYLCSVGGISSRGSTRNRTVRLRPCPSQKRGSRLAPPDLRHNTGRPRTSTTTENTTKTQGKRATVAIPSIPLSIHTTGTRSPLPRRRPEGETSGQIIYLTHEAPMRDSSAHPGIIYSHIMFTLLQA